MGNIRTKQNPTNHTTPLLQKLEYTIPCKTRGCTQYVCCKNCYAATDLHYIYNCKNCLKHMGHCHACSETLENKEEKGQLNRDSD